MTDNATPPLCTPAFMKIVVPDAEASVEFYSKAFGLVRTETLDFPTILEIFLESPEGGAAIVLVSYKSEFELKLGNGWGPFGFETDDLDALLERVLAAGAKIVIPAGVINNTRYVILTSPEGHQIELVQYIED